MIFVIQEKIVINAMIGKILQHMTTRKNTNMFHAFIGDKKMRMSHHRHYKRKNRDKKVIKIR